MTAFHCALAWLPDRGPVADVVVEVAGDRITGVTPGAPAPAGAVRFGGLALPGFANAHSHAFHRALRGRTSGAPGSFWTWRERMYAIANRLDPDTYFTLARAVFSEMALAGITCVGEFHYVHHQPDGTPYADPNAMGSALCAAAADAGLRLTLLDACYLHGAAGAAPLEPAQRRFSDGSARAWAARAGARDRLRSPTVRLGAAIHSVRAVDPDSIEAVAAFARRAGWPLHAHVSEQAGENDACLAAYGLTPTAVLHARNALSPEFTAVHATHVAGNDLVLLGTHRCTVCLCPTTERDLADGIGPAHELASAGAGLALGSDAQAVVDPFEEARAVELNERLRSARRGTFTPGALLRAAGEQGHRALGWTGAGRIEPGALADLVVVDLGSVRTAGVDPAEIVFAATAADVRDVVIGGRHIVAGGMHHSIDVAGELSRAIRAVT